MKQDENILNRLGRRDGMTVPDGYFADFAERMAAALPERPELAATKIEVPRTRWERIRPYAYLAAMFAGVWCMLKMFTMLTVSTPQPLDANPIIAEAVSNDTFVNEYVISELSQWDLYDDLMDDGIAPDALLDSAEFFSNVPSDLKL